MPRSGKNDLVSAVAHCPVDRAIRPPIEIPAGNRGADLRQIHCMRVIIQTDVPPAGVSTVRWQRLSRARTAPEHAAAPGSREGLRALRHGPLKAAGITGNGPGAVDHAAGSSAGNTSVRVGKRVEIIASHCRARLGQVHRSEVVYPYTGYIDSSLRQDGG